MDKFYAIGATCLTVFMIISMLILIGMIFKDWDDCGHFMAVTYICMIIVTAISYWCLFEKCANILRNL